MLIRPQNVLAGLIMLSPLCLAGCASTYKAPSDPAMSASVEVYKGYKTGVGFGTGTQQEYSIYANDKCDKPKRLASFTWIDGTSKSKTVAANEPLRIGAITNYYSPGGGGYWNGTAYVVDTDVNSCPSFVRFTPKPGAKYKLIQNELDGKGCDIEVINLATMKTPQDLVIGETQTCTELKPVSEI